MTRSGWVTTSSIIVIAQPYPCEEADSACSMWLQQLYRRGVGCVSWPLDLCRSGIERGYAL